MATRAAQQRQSYGGVLLALENDPRLLAIPSGGTTGQVLARTSGTNYATGWVTPSGGSGGGSSKVTATGVALGSQNASQSAFTYYQIPAIAARGIVSQLVVTADAAGLFDVEVRGAGSTAGSLWLQALGVSTPAYNNPTVWYFEDDAATQDLYVGVRNTGAATRTFTLTSLRVERFA
jgi:hypothetical protein